MYYSIFCLLFASSCQYWCPTPSTIPVVEDKSLKTQYQVSYVPLEAMEVDPPSLQTLLSVSLPSAG